MNKKLITVVLIITLTVGVFIWPARQAQAADWYYWLDNFIIRPLMRKIANSLENRLLTNMHDTIVDKGGADPHFLQDWRSDTLTSSAMGVDVFRAVLANTQLCDYFKNNLLDIFGATQYAGLLAGGTHSLTNPPGTESFELTTQCGLTTDPVAFGQDFAQGGWQAWDELFQPSNNLFGAFFTAENEKLAQTVTDQKSTADERVAGAGSKPSRENLVGGGTGASGCAVEVNGRCLFLGRTVTPARIFTDASDRFFQQKPEEIRAARELTDLLLIIQDAVVSRVVPDLKNFLAADPYNNNSMPVGAARSAQAQGQARGQCQNSCSGRSTPQCNRAIDPTACQNNAFLSCQTGC